MPIRASCFDVLSDIVETQKANYSETALLSANCYNSVTKRRELLRRALIPARSLPFHIWKSLVEKAGHKIAEIPNTWDARWDFFKGVHKKLRDQGMRSVVRALASK